MSDRETDLGPVGAVLCGEASYDSLPDAAGQAAVRAAWDEQITERLDGLDLAADFEVAGESWVEADADGTTIIRNT